MFSFFIFFIYSLPLYQRIIQDMFGKLPLLSDKIFTNMASV